ncbi:MAG: type IV-A pilus assembly ATPase PilB, partial [Moraxellaceae bacterium]
MFMAAEQTASVSFGGLARRLVNDGVVAADNMQRAMAVAQREKITLVTALVTHMGVSSNQVANIIAQEFGDPLFDLDALDNSAIPTDIVEEKIIRQFTVLPIFKRGNRLSVAMSDPTRVDAIDAI